MEDKKEVKREKSPRGVSHDDEARVKGKREGKACSNLFTDSGVCEDTDFNDDENNVPENEEVPECPAVHKEIEDLPGCSSVETSTEWQQELTAVDEYLFYFDQKRYGAQPEVNSLFESLWNAENYTYNRLGISNTAEDAKHLRWKALDLVRQKLNTYRPFMKDKQSDEEVLRRQVHEIDIKEKPADYTIFMALTNVLEAVVLVTECSRSGNVRTNSYYFGRNRPKKLLHICWISSLRYYDAVVECGKGSGIDIGKQLLEKQLEALPDTKPSHECDFRICSDARVYESPHQLRTPATVEDRFMKDPVENDDCDVDCCSLEHVNLTDKEDHPESDSEA